MVLLGFSSLLLVWYMVISRSVLHPLFSVSVFVSLVKGQGSMYHEISLHSILVFSEYHIIWTSLRFSTFASLVQIPLNSKHRIIVVSHPLYPGQSGAKLQPTGTWSLVVSASLQQWSKTLTYMHFLSTLGNGCRAIDNINFLLIMISVINLTLSISSD